ncbi:hypothetical protein AKO1_006077 [Acrasis kona]|uniref:Rhodanese domain-containing protein n=1 Tax=Acrasis kona TaxID=1008807 RepID=A0AAW2YHU8_9EUKA
MEQQDTIGTSTITNFTFNSFDHNGLNTEEGYISYEDLEQSIYQNSQPQSQDLHKNESIQSIQQESRPYVPTIFDNQPHKDGTFKDKKMLPHTGLGSAFRKATTWVCHTFNSNALFPNNKYITVEELVRLLQRPNPEDRPFLIDARKESEFKESHIEGSTNLHDPDKLESVNWLKEIPEDKLIVSYCAVGLRSGYLAKRIVEELGHKNTVTLKGAFYRWANMDLPMVNGDNHPVHKVVPHQILARTLLKPEIRTSLRGHGDNEHIKGQ